MLHVFNMLLKLYFILIFSRDLRSNVSHTVSLKICIKFLLWGIMKLHVQMQTDGRFYESLIRHWQRARRSRAIHSSRHIPCVVFRTTQNSEKTSSDLFKINCTVVPPVVCAVIPTRNYRSERRV